MVRLILKMKRMISLRLKSTYSFFKQVEWKVLYEARYVSANRLYFGNSFEIHFDSSISSVKIGKDVQFRNFCQLRTGMNGELIIGNRVFFNNYCSITCFHYISIGDNCQFGEGVKFYDHNHQYKTSDKLISDQGYSTGSIKIGNNCWIGSNVIILKDVVIGDNVVIGAGCIIHKSVPSGSVIINKQQLLNL